MNLCSKVAMSQLYHGSFICNEFCTVTTIDSCQVGYILTVPPDLFCYSVGYHIGGYGTRPTISFIFFGTNLTAQICTEILPSTLCFLFSCGRIFIEKEVAHETDLFFLSRKVRHGTPLLLGQSLLFQEVRKALPPRQRTRSESIKLPPLPL